MKIKNGKIKTDSKLKKCDNRSFEGPLEGGKLIQHTAQRPNIVLLVICGMSLRHPSVCAFIVNNKKK